MRLEFSTLFELYTYSTRKYANRVVNAFSEGDFKYTFSEFDKVTRKISRDLSNFGLGSHDKIAILSENMPNWVVAFFAITAFGRIAVPMLTELSENEITNIINHSEAKALFVSKKLLSHVPTEIQEKLNLIICTDNLEVIKAKDESWTCDGTTRMPLLDDIAAIFYTSGTSGTAKGVMLSHRNLCVQIHEAWGCYKVYKKDIFLSILPLAHTYEMSISMLYPFARGSKVYYLQKPPTPSVLISTLKKVRPTVMLSVPLIIEKIYKSSVLPTINRSRFLTWIRSFSPSLLYWLVGFKLRKTFGGRMQFFGIGGAKLDPTVEAFLKKAHFNYAIGYGLTETAPLICGAGPKVTKVGSTGKPAYGVQVKLYNFDETTGEGEIVVKGDNVMRGYFKDFERTKNAFTEDGWFRTGDLASVDKKGRYYIKGRIGNLILGPSGENIYPEEIENVINQMSDVSESLVTMRDGHLVALIQFNDNVLDWNFENEDKFLAEMEERKKAIMEYVNSKVNKSSKINDVEVLKEPFVKTATHKIKRFLYKQK